MPFLNFLFQPKRAGNCGRSVAPAQSDASEPEKNCPNRHRDIPISTLWSNYNTCPCGYHFRMSARQRLHYLTDRESFTELFADVVTGDPLGFPNYAEKIETVRASSKVAGGRCLRHRPHQRPSLRPVPDGAVLHDGQHGRRRR